MRSIIPFAVSVTSCIVVGCVVMDDDPVDTLVTMNRNLFWCSKCTQTKKGYCSYHNPLTMVIEDYHTCIIWYFWAFLSVTVILFRELSDAILTVVLWWWFGTRSWTDSLPNCTRFCASCPRGPNGPFTINWKKIPEKQVRYLTRCYYLCIIF